MESFSFSVALELLKDGQLVARSGWNGPDQCLYLVQGSVFTVNRPPLNAILAEGTKVNYLPHIDIRTAQGDFVPWLASQGDLLADDWHTVEL